MSVAAASKYCCEKRMALLSLETRSELKCLGKEMKSKFSLLILLHRYTNLTLHWQSSKTSVQTLNSGHRLRLKNVQRTLPGAAQANFWTTRAWKFPELVWTLQNSASPLCSTLPRLPSPSKKMNVQTTRPKPYAK
jgi:hypothetical protein